MRWGNRAFIGVCAAVVAVIMADNFRFVNEMNDLNMQACLRLYSESIYEYHALTGKWPSRIDDLLRTSLPLKDPHQAWISQLETEADIIVWPKNLKPDPQENAHIILCYHNKGLDAERGRMWVCWGDLRTECISREELHEHLNEGNKVEKPVDPRLVGVWQNRSDSKEIWTVRVDGTLKWFYQGVPAIGISDSTVAYTYRADPEQAPAHLDLIHQGVMGTSHFIYEVTGNELRIGIGSGKLGAGVRPNRFGPMDRYYKRVHEPSQKTSP